MSRQIPPEAYGPDFFLSPFLEGFDEYERGALSVVKQKQLEMLAPREGVRLLEVGYGRGELLLHCARRGAEVVGVDYSPAAYDIARGTLRGCPNAELHVADCRALPFEAGSFDLVFAGDVIEHLCSEDAVRMLREMHRVAKPGGTILVHTTPNTFFTGLVYPVAKHLLRLIDRRAVGEIDAHLRVMKRLHVDEYNLFSLRRAARLAGYARARVWIDDDLTRSGRHRHTRSFSSNPLVRLVMAGSRLSTVRLLLGNDLYLKCVKPADKTPGV